MIYKYLIFIISLFYTTVTVAQTSETFLGSWLNENKEVKVEISKIGNNINARLIWMKGNGFDPIYKTPLLDSKNENANFRARPLIGITIFKSENYQGGQVVSGTCYNPVNGTSGKCILTLIESKKIILKSNNSVIINSKIWFKTND